MNYNAQLCKTALEKNGWHESRSVRVFDSKTMTDIFFEALGRIVCLSVKVLICLKVICLLDYEIA